MIQIKNILCPIDFFPASLKAYEYALKLAANYEAGIYALHVVSPIVPTAYDFPLNLSEYTGALQKNSRVELAKLGKKAEKVHVPFRSEVVIGSIDVEIHKALKKTKADFVVMGTHGRRGLERWILGSEADRMLRSCPVPLLTMSVVKGTRTAPPAIRSILVTTDFSEGTAEVVEVCLLLRAGMSGASDVAARGGSGDCRVFSEVFAADDRCDTTSAGETRTRRCAAVVSGEDKSRGGCAI